MYRNYFKVAIRNLLKHKMYGLLNIMGLALSITCALLIFLLVKYHMGFDNYHNNPERIYRVVTEQHRDNVMYTFSTPPALGSVLKSDFDFEENISRIVNFENAVVGVETANGIEKFKEPAGAAFVEPGYFGIFKYPMLNNGNPEAALTDLGAVIITERLAKKYFGNASPINKIIHVDNVLTVRVTGVLKDIPSNTDNRAEIFMSFKTLKEVEPWFTQPDAWGGITTALQLYIKLKPNVSPAQVENALPAYVKKFRTSNKNVHVYKLQPLNDVHFNPLFGGVIEKKTIWILSFIGIFLIITACVNFINLSTAQALRRSKEVGIRKVLGSMRWQLFWQFMAETIIITVVASVIAFVFTTLLVPYVNNLFNARLALDTFKDPILLAFMPVLMLFVAFLAGFYPGLVLSGFKPITALKGKMSFQQIGGFNTRRVLIVTQFTICLVLMIGMIVITRQVRFTQNTDLGFKKDAILMVPLRPSDDDQKGKYLKEQLLKVPGVLNGSLCYAAPSSAEQWNTNIRFDTRTEQENFLSNIKSSDADYINTFQIKLVAGRNLFPSDSVREVLVNETLVNKLGLTSPDQALNRMLYIAGGDQKAMIVGVMKDFHDGSLRRDIHSVAITTIIENYNNVALTVDLNKLNTIMPAIEKIWTATYPDYVYEYTFLDHNIAQFYATETTMLELIRVFSFIAIFIGCLGLYGLISFMASQKTKEIGIRKLLGSSIGRILWIFGKEFSVLIGIAFIIAAPLAGWLMSKWLEDFKYHVKIDATVFLIAVAATIFITLLTISYQGVKAALANPIKNLRSE
ncbi:putative permease [Chitinophaga skermanii]|uniref:Putative permease n=1 Tax=Chitinophaga skermanii TaxID=331697 RepID=A0A327QNA4_9BACT|nr:ABC transporter permease [Chitinophaga skermanii]RAJ05174.1 putative permease [Chitinophaga skermanii]